MLYYEFHNHHEHNHHKYHYREHHHHEVSPLRGLLHIVILKVISETPLHGGEIQRKISEKFGLNVPKAMIYGILRRLEHHNLVTSKWVIEEGGPAKRVYYITDDGLEYLNKAIEKLEKVRSIIDKLLSKPKQ